MNILIIGGGGRESSIAWKLAQSPNADRIFVLPGNAGTAVDYENVDLDPNDFEACIAFTKDNDVKLVVIGPEDPLVHGMADAFEDAGIKVFGPNRKAAQFEGSKAFTKDFLIRHNIPTAKYHEYHSYEDLVNGLDEFGYPVVLKADGLAAGKGVLICEDRAQALAGANEIMKDRAFGDAGDTVVVEEFLTGREASMLCFLDGKTLVPMESAQDYKRAFDGDKGTNTGGMGSYSPNVLFDDWSLVEKITDTILHPTLEGFVEDGIDFRGVLFVGLMIKDNEPKVLEFNVRFGDPETQSVLYRLDSDLLDIMLACADGRLAETPIEWSEEPAVSVVMASGGYPGSYPKGKEITGLDTLDGVTVFHAGTKLEDGKVLTSGGRVLAVTAKAPTVEEARQKVYEEVGKISFDGGFCRSDIAKLD